ncbi:MAG: hypothetical protein US20_C0005G0015 [Candidatus Pacebacteria bacterium GW2011_GWF1_36_5]|nr:MAG: hypothetical protein US20_C0005G0015 [Candidatus Pacebacteria bacterium GW2011_GWF1_36_5]
MASTSATGTVWNLPNYIGELFQISRKQTPLLNMLGGTGALQRGGLVNSFEFPLNQTYSLDSASQPAITETASLTAPTSSVYARSQTTNTVQIFQKAVTISYAKMSNNNAISGLALTGQQQQVTNEKDFQIAANLEQIALDVNYTFHNGAYQQAVNAGTAAKTRGLLSAVSTNAVAAGTTVLTKALIDQLLKAMADNGATFGDMFMFVNSFQKQKVSDVYSYVPDSRNVGGSNIKQIETDFCIVNVVFDPHVPAASLGIYDMSAIKAVGCPVPDKGVLFYEELSKTGASESGQLYGQIGLDYGHETQHGKITGLTTS